MQNKSHDTIILYYTCLGQGAVVIAIYQFYNDEATKYIYSDANNKTKQYLQAI